MTWLKLVWDEVLGMFVDDGALALHAAVLIAVVALAVKVLGVPALVGGLVLLVGCIIVLGASLARKVRRG